MLRSQGWTPGSFLGPQDAPHAELHSSASASYIRVAMKDDAGGLGYRAGGGPDDDIAGMDEVKSIFDRLNGVVESEEAKKERERRKALVYLGQRVGGITFVRGGLLVQEDLDMVQTKEKERVEALEGKGKRKAEETEEDAPRKKRRGDDEKEKRRRKEEKRKRKARIADSEISPVGSSATTEDDEGKPKKSKKSKRDKSASETPADHAEEPKKDKTKRSKSKSTDPASDSSPDDPPKKSKKSKSETPSSEPTADAPRKEKKSKEEKKLEKEERKKEKKEKKRLKKASKSSGEDELSDTTPADSDVPTGTSTPSTGPGVRHYHHARRVAAKRAAMTDAAALKQVGVPHSLVRMTWC